MQETSSTAGSALQMKAATSGDGASGVFLHGTGTLRTRVLGGTSIYFNLFSGEKLIYICTERLR